MREKSSKDNSWGLEDSSALSIITAGAHSSKFQNIINVQETLPCKGKVWSLWAALLKL